MDNLDAINSSGSSSPRMSRRWARKCERYCCLGFTYFPLVFVYSITTWAMWVETQVGMLTGGLLGNASAFFGAALWALLNWSYTTAVFRSPGTTTNSSQGYNSLPSHAEPVASNLTVKSNGEMRFCKKCNARKPDRAHHCSTCRACVLKMDHHCPWLATCVGLHNYKAFLLFLIYTTVFCFLCFGVTASWSWTEILNDGINQDALMPVQYVMLAVISAIIGIVLAGFTGWHILLASRNQTTIECLEKTRYLSSLRKTARRDVHFVDGHAPRQPLDDMVNGEQRHHNYEEMQRARARARYEEYLDEQDSEKLPSAFDHGRRRNFAHLFGPKKLLWAFPICNTVGDGWYWEPSPKWVEERARIAREREEQRNREHSAGWGEPSSSIVPPVQTEGAGRHYVSYPQSTPSYSQNTAGSSKADRILGRKPDQYADSGMSMQTLRPREQDDYDLEADAGADEEDYNEGKGLVTNWPRQVERVGMATNMLLGNTTSRQKDGVRGWDGNDDDEID